MDPIRNPYAPGAGQRPPELAGRDEQLAAFEVVLEPLVAEPVEKTPEKKKRRGKPSPGGDRPPDQTNTIEDPF